MSDIYLLIFLVCVLGVFVFTISGVISLFKKQPSKDEWIRMLIFIILGFIFFVLFGLSL